MQCILVTPERTVRDDTADFVAAPLYDGEIGIAPQHGPMIGRLTGGELRITQGETVGRYYVEGGFLEVLGDVVTVLTSRVVPAAQIDPQAVEVELRAASDKKAVTPDEVALRDRTMADCRAQLRIAQHVGS